MNRSAGSSSSDRTEPELTPDASSPDLTKPAASAERCAVAFGLDISSEVALPFMEGAPGTPTGRHLALAVDDGAARSEWPPSARLVCSAREPDGGVIFRIETHADHGYLISGREYGAHLLSADGRSLRCCPEGRPASAWQRLLIAQVLPFAALLQGLEVLHSSAVVRDGRGLAFLGPSGAGKTSIALELCSRGASFLADDVLALEVRGTGLVAHPGTQLASVDEAQTRRMRADEELTPERIIEIDPRERLVRMAGAAEPAPLAALFFLDRRAAGPAGPRFEPAADAQLLLSATFNFALTTPERLRGLLEACALAARLRVERIVYGPTTSVSQLGAAIELRLGAPR
jgi:hypothetical protein